MPKTASGRSSPVNVPDRGIGPDAEREREHGHGGEAGVLQQLAEGEFEIIHNEAPPSDQLLRHGGQGQNLPQLLRQ